MAIDLGFSSASAGMSVPVTLDAQRSPAWPRSLPRGSGLVAGIDWYYMLLMRMAIVFISNALAPAVIERALEAGTAIS